MAQQQEARPAMNSHDESPNDIPAENAETAAFLRRIVLSAVPMDRDRLLWDCGYEAGKAASGRPAPTAGRSIRAWLPSLASSAAAFFIGLATAGVYSGNAALRDVDRAVATALSPVVEPASAKPYRPATAAPRLKKPREGLYASVPLGRLEELLAAPTVPPAPRRMIPPPDRPPLRIRDAMLNFDSIDL